MSTELESLPHAALASLVGALAHFVPTADYSRALQDARATVAARSGKRSRDGAVAVACHVVVPVEILSIARTKLFEDALTFGSWMDAVPELMTTLFELDGVVGRLWLSIIRS